MKNLKKLSRQELSKVSGGLEALGMWCCADTHGNQSTGVYGDSDTLTCKDDGTHLSRC